MSRQSKKRAYEDAKDRALAEGICVGDIVKILKYDPDKMTVDVMPIVNYPDEDKYQNCTPVLAVPIAPIFGGGFFVRPWYEVGDLGVVFYFDRDSDTALAGGDIADPNTERLHSGDDAVFVGGIIAGSKRVPGSFPREAFVVGTEVGDVYAAVFKDEIKAVVQDTLLDAKPDKITMKTQNVEISAGGNVNVVAAGTITATGAQIKLN